MRNVSQRLLVKLMFNDVPRDFFLVENNSIWLTLMFKRPLFLWDNLLATFSDNGIQHHSSVHHPLERIQGADIDIHVPLHLVMVHIFLLHENSKFEEIGCISSVNFIVQSSSIVAFKGT